MGDRESFERTVAIMLASGASRTEAELDFVIQMLRSLPLFQALTDVDVAQAKRVLTERLRIEMDLGVAVTSAFEPWLEKRYAEIKWRHWLTYKAWLVGEGWALPVLDSMASITDRLLEFAGDPLQSGSWSRRGLAIGDVQSGKTATYMGLFNKAVDAGYRLIIVLAGGTEVLRQQTQRRVDEGLIGRDSTVTPSKHPGAHGTSRFVGIGTLDATVANATGMTTVAQDFRKTSYQASNIQIAEDSHSAYVFVLKKNKAVLSTLGTWLDDQPKKSGRIPLPVLVLDDEADYASVNTRADDDPTTINRAIREILNKFSRSSYLAFTATPFANIFIDSDQGDDLFPRDYVYALEPPTNYAGSNATFGTMDDASATNTVVLNDAEEWVPVKHKATYAVAGLNASLRDAIATFFVANAIRDLRKDDRPRAMLVNVSRFKAVQRQVFNLVQEEAVVLRNALDFHSALYAAGHPNKPIGRLEAAFRSQYAKTAGVTWDEVLSALRNASARIEVQLHNSDRDKALADQEAIWNLPARVIAVGGDVLSRGLTLNGLTVSYFHRNVGAFDTLMQMARWFGYRDGYGDLCRIWMDEDITAQYRFVQAAIDELRLDLQVMHQQKLTPADFGLAVRKHPGALLVTARNKMRAATDSEKEISLAGRRVESTMLSANDEQIKANLAALEHMVSRLASLTQLQDKSDRRRRPVWRAVSKDIVADFLDQFAAGVQDTLFLPGLSQFVRGASATHLQNWDVVIVNGDRKAAQPRTLPGAPAIQFWPPVRKVTTEQNQFRISGKSSRLAGADDVASLLNDADRKVIEAGFRRDQADGDGARPPSGRNPTKKPGEVDFYSKLERPLLMVYPLIVSEQLSPEAYKILAGRYLIAAKIAIKRSSPTDRSADVKYVINRVAQRNWFPEYVQGEDDNDVDE